MCWFLSSFLPMHTDNIRRKVWSDWMNLIGKSLSMCVVDILHGRINREDIMFIYAGTMIRDFEEMMEVSFYYMRDGGPWEGFDMRNDILPVLSYLIFNNKLFQPRLYDGVAS